MWKLLKPSIRHSTVNTKKIRSIGREMKEIMFFSIWRKASKWLKCVAEIIAFIDPD